jgi:type I restriction enzyme S subunit
VSKWEEVSLGDVADALVGFAFKSASFTDDPNDVRLLRGVNIGQGFLDWSRTAYWPTEDCEHYARYELADGDVVLAMDRPWIEAGLKRARIRNGALPALLVQRVTRLRGTERVRTSFLHHVLASRVFSDYIKPIVTGVNVPHISPAQIAAFRFRLPSLTEQDAICSVLDALDELIENNRRRIALLEQMAQAIYREWFLHFRYPGHEDDELVDSPLGPVPARFEVTPLGAWCNINREQRRPEPDEEIVYIDISALGDRTVALPSPIPGSDAPGRARRVLSDGDIVWSMVRPGRRAHALLVKAPADWIGSTGLAVISPNGVPSSFVFEFVSTPMFSDYLVGKEQGAAYPAVRPIDLEQAQTAVPPEEVLRAFDDVVSPIHVLGWELAAQARVAAQLRELLLPKLVTGVIDVSHIDLDALLDESAA